MRRRLFAVLAAASLVAGVAIPAGASHPSTATYEVTITNTNPTQWFTPPVVATHARAFDLIKRNQPAGTEIMELAENGNLDPILAALEASPYVHSYTVAATEAGPLAPGESVTVTIEGDRNARQLLVASMLICTNDGFTGFDGRRLPSHVGQTRTYTAFALDAGTEINTEYLGDIVPPCQALNGVTGDEGTGMSDPALAEDGVIKRHRGIKGIDDLTYEAHGWNPRSRVVSVEVTRTG